jgi:hypothetical protein
MPHCDHCATAPVNDYGLRRAHCATCGVLCWDDPRDFEQGAAFCSDFCRDVWLMARWDAPLSDALQVVNGLHGRTHYAA